MHTLEAFIYILSIVMMWVVFTKKTIQKPVVFSLFGVLVVVFILHLIIDGTRWQLYTLYLSILLFGTIAFFKVFQKPLLPTIARRSILTISVILLVVSWISAFVFPIYNMPIPSGDYLIGTESFVIEDSTRFELYSDDSTEYRKIKIQIWYPAETIDGYDQVPWLEDGIEVARALSKDTGLPAFVLDHDVKILSNSYAVAPISSDLSEYPVIILSHGWRGFRNLHTDYAEELASLGYIVVGIDHTYGSVATVFSEGDVAYLNLDALPPRETTPNFLEYANQLVNTYGSDVTATLNYLEALNDTTSNSRFQGKFDLDKVGLLGHSTGGGGDVAVAINDDRIDAVIGLDAWVESIDDSEISNGLSIPSLFLRSESWEIGENNAKLYALIGNSSYPSKFYQINGTTHYDFAMVYMYSPLVKSIGFSGSIDNETLHTILQTMITDFFNETLRNESSNTQYPQMWDDVQAITIP